VGRPTSTVHVTVRDVDEVLPQTSVAVNVLVCDPVQLVVEAAPSVEVIVTVPQASVAVAVPSEPEGLAGLHPNTTVE
jgi:hypothetical protein